MSWLDWFVDALVGILGFVAFAIGLLVIVSVAVAVGAVVSEGLGFGVGWGWVAGSIAFVPLLAALMATAAKVVNPW